MNVSDKIYQEVKKLPEPLQAEVLDFVEYLALKLKREISSEDDLSLTDLSLCLGMAEWTSGIPRDRDHRNRSLFRDALERGI